LPSVCLPIRELIKAVGSIFIESKWNKLLHEQKLNLAVLIVEFHLQNTWSFKEILENIPSGKRELA